MKPTPNESRDEFMQRCSTQMLDDGEAEDGEDADTMCATMWDDAGMKSAAPMKRAYGFLQIKSVNDEQRIIEGMASTPSPDRMQDVVNPLSAKFSTPFPLLMGHDPNQPVGEVFEARPSAKGIAVKARIFKATQSRTLIERLDEAYESVKLKLLTGFSIGFRPIDPPEIIKETGGYHYKGAYEILELSLCALPAQAEAQISVVKSLFAAQRQRGVVRLDEVTIAKARRVSRPGVVYLK